MATYLLNIEIKSQTNHQTLKDELENFRALKITENTWQIKRFETDSFNLKEFFRLHISPEDRLIVAEIRESSSWNPITKIEE